jgi:hypothetical protein
MRLEWHPEIIVVVVVYEARAAGNLWMHRSRLHLVRPKTRCSFSKGVQDHDSYKSRIRIPTHGTHHDADRGSLSSHGGLKICAGITGCCKVCREVHKTKYTCGGCGGWLCATNLLTLFQLRRPRQHRRLRLFDDTHRSIVDLSLQCC